MLLDRLPPAIVGALASLVEACAASGHVTHDGRDKQAAIREAIIAIRPACAAWDRAGRPLEPLPAPPPPGNSAAAPPPAPVAPATPSPVAATKESADATP